MHRPAPDATFSRQKLNETAASSAALLVEDSCWGRRARWPGVGDTQKRRCIDEWLERGRCFAYGLRLWLRLRLRLLSMLQLGCDLCKTYRSATTQNARRSLRGLL